MPEKQIEALLAQSFTANVSADGKFVGLQFETSREPISVAFPANQVDKAVSLLISAASHIAKEFPDEISKSQILSGKPIPASEMTVTSGDQDAKALIAMQSGPMRLVFSVELATLRRNCHEALQSMRWDPDSPKTQ